MSETFPSNDETTYHRVDQEAIDLQKKSLENSSDLELKLSEITKETESKIAETLALQIPEAEKTEIIRSIRNDSRIKKEDLITEYNTAQKSLGNTMRDRLL